MAVAPPSKLDKQFSAYLRGVLKRENWTYVELERACGIKKSMLHNIVNHERGASLSLVSRFCENMDVDVMDIFSPPAARTARKSQ